MSGRRRSAVGLIAGALIATSVVVASTSTTSAQSDQVVVTSTLNGPAGSQRFGEQVLVLSNGNYVVDDPGFDVGNQADVGAIYLYDGDTDTIISTLVGSTQGDRIGSGGFYEVGSSDFVVVSPDWSSPDTSTVGAVTWVDGTSGLDARVSTTNSLFGASTFQFQDPRETNPTSITTLANGNYVITSAVPGASLELFITWGDGNGGTAGEIGASNSVVSDGGPFVRARSLANGNYVVTHNGIVNGVEASSLFWGNGVTGDPADSTELRSGVGAPIAPFEELFAELTNGDVVVATPNWKFGRGAVTVIDGSTGRNGLISASNSLVGQRGVDNAADGADFVGEAGVYALTNGNFVIHSPRTRNAAGTREAALTLIDGADVPTGSLTAQRSVYGATTSALEYRSVVPLTNGNFVFSDPLWDSDDAEAVGLVRLFSGTSAPGGRITANNSLIGSTFADQVGSRGIVALSDGDYAVLSPEWNDFPSAQQAGAVTWQDGETATTAEVSAANSLVGSRFQDRIGSHGVVALPDGAAAVASAGWKRTDTSVANGALTWVSGSSRTTGAVTTANSLYGASSNDQVGLGVGVLDNGDYVVYSSMWDSGRGAVTLGSSGSPIGPVSDRNSLVGIDADSFFGSGDAQSLDDGRFFVWSPDLGQGAVTLGTPEVSSGVASTANSALEFDLRRPAALVTTGGAIVIPTRDNRVVLLRHIDDAPPPTTTTTTTTTVPSTTTTTVPSATTTTTVPPATTTTTVPTSSQPAPPDPDRDLVAVSPARLLDTRGRGQTTDGASQAEGLVAADQVVRFQVASRGGVSATATAAELNLTAIRPQGSGHATLFPCGAEVPTASSLNFAAGVTIANSVIVPLTASGDVCLVSAAASNFAVDVVGFVPQGSAVEPVDPARLLDSRPSASTIDNDFEAIGAIGRGEMLEVTVAGRAGVPGNATAAVLNLTAVRPEARGFATLYPCSSSLPNSSSLNYSAGLKVANGALVPLSSTGTICLFTSSTAHYLIDVSGFVSGVTDIDTFEPTRLLDTRRTAGAATVDGIAVGAGRVSAGQVIEVQVAGRGTVSSDADIALVNLTVVGSLGAGFATLHPCTSEVPNASSINFWAGANLANASIAELSSTGSVCIFTSVDAHFLLDATGALDE